MAPQTLLHMRLLPPFLFSTPQALHLEDNELVGPLPLGPFLRSLRELLLDWQAALDSPPALATATRLSRLVLSGHRAVDLHADGGLTVRPAAAAEPLLAALAAMPSLALVEDVQGEVRTLVAEHWQRWPRSWGSAARAARWGTGTPRREPCALHLSPSMHLCRRTWSRLQWPTPCGTWGAAWGRRCAGPLLQAVACMQPPPADPARSSALLLNEQRCMPPCAAALHGPS